MPQVTHIRLNISILAACLLLVAGSVRALDQTAASDILKDPLRYQSSVAKVVGEVVKVEPDIIKPGAGTYTILDSSDATIRVRTAGPLPLAGENLYVIGLVYQEDPQAKPYLDELKRGPAGPPMKFLVGAAGVLALIAFVLAYLLLWHRSGPSRSGRGSEDAAPRKVITQVFQDDPVAVLSAVAGPHKGQTFNVYRGVTSIGRDDDQTVRLSEDQTVSRQQARILAEDGAVSLVNESSTNPTMIGGEPVEKRELTDGDVLQMGATKLKLTVFEE